MKKHGKVERRKLHNIRAAIDDSKGPQRIALAWMARALGPDKLEQLDYHLGDMAGNSAFEKTLASFDKKTRTILEMRVKGKSFAEIGKVFNQSGSNMSRIQEKAFRRLLWVIKYSQPPISEKVFELHRGLFAKMGFWDFYAVKLETRYRYLPVLS